jgi:hypothetical protein
VARMKERKKYAPERTRHWRTSRWGRISTWGIRCSLIGITVRLFGDWLITQYDGYTHRRSLPLYRKEYNTTMAKNICAGSWNDLGDIFLRELSVSQRQCFNLWST